jgi:hypothetical protein
MKRTLGSLACVSLFIVLVFDLFGLRASGKEWMRDEFKSQYVKQDSKDPKDIAFREAVERARCAVCHAGPDGEKQKALNAYGRQFGKSVKKRDKNDRQKLDAAFKKLEASKQNANDAGSPTFGELIGQGKLPAGDAR